MTQLLFRNRWFALLWALGLCFTISRFFGDGGGQQQLAQAADKIRKSRAESAQKQSPAEQEFDDSQMIRGRVVHEVRGAQFESEYSDSPERESEAY